MLDRDFLALESGFREAETRWRLGDHVGALESMRQLLQTRLQGTPAADLSAADMVVVEHLADLAVLCGLVRPADELLHGLADLSSQAGNRFAADYAALKRVNLALLTGDLAAAQSFLRAMWPSLGDVDAIEFSASGLAAWERGRPWRRLSLGDQAVLFSRAHHALGTLLAALGQYQQAACVLERGLEHSGNAVPSLAQQARVPLELTLAGALMEMGELDAAEARLTALAPRLNETATVSELVRWQEVDGKLRLLRGELGQALERFETVLTICERHQLPRAAIRAAVNLAQVKILLNQTREADELAESANKLAIVLQDPAVAARVARLRRVVRARGSSLAAEVAIAPPVSVLWAGDPTPRARSEADDSPFQDPPPSANFLTLFEDRALGFYWEVGRADFARAGRRYADMAVAFAATDSAIVHARLQLMAGTLHYYQGDLESAERELLAARNALRGLGLRVDLWQTQRILRWCWAARGRPSAEQDALVSDTATLLDQMTASLAPANRPVYLLNKWTADEEALAVEIDGLLHMQQSLVEQRWPKPWRRLAVLKRGYRLLQHIDRYKHALAQQAVGGTTEPAGQDAPMSIWRYLLSQPRDRATVSFLVLPDRVLVARIGWLTLDFGLANVSRIELRGTVRRWHEAVSTSSDELWGPASVEPTDIARSLTESLQIPRLLAALPHRVRALKIVADDSLHGFPFAALVHNGAYLIERFALTQAFDHATCRLPKAQRWGASNSVRKALLVGVSRGVPRGEHRFPPLPGVRRELERVESTWQRRGIETQVLLDDTATKQQVCDELPRAELAHLACHGIFDADRPDESGLVLVPVPMQIDILTLRELARVDLTGLDHVTLSSCWSADHFVLPGRWIIGLPEVLWRGGARSVLGSLWEVDDDLAVQLVERFYDYLETHPRDQALQLAQLDFIQGAAASPRAADARAPQAWAGFCLYGEHRPIRLSKHPPLGLARSTTKSYTPPLSGGG